MTLWKPLVILIFLLLIASPVLATQKFHTGDIIQRTIPPPNNAYWKVWGYNQTSGNYLIEPMRAVHGPPCWLPIGNRIWMTRRFIDPRFTLKGNSAMCRYVEVESIAGSVKEA